MSSVTSLLINGSVIWLRWNGGVIYGWTRVLPLGSAGLPLIIYSLNGTFGPNSFWTTVKLVSPWWSSFFPSHWSSCEESLWNYSKFSIQFLFQGASIIRMLVKFWVKIRSRRVCVHTWRSTSTEMPRLLTCGNRWLRLLDSPLLKSWLLDQDYWISSLSVEAEKAAENFNLKVTQNRFLNGGNVRPEEDETIWSVPLRLATDSGVVEEAGLLTSRSGTFQVPLTTEFFKFNFEQAGFYRVHYPSEWLQNWAKPLKLVVSVLPIVLESFLTCLPFPLPERFPCPKFWVFWASSRMKTITLSGVKLLLVWVKFYRFGGRKRNRFKASCAPSFVPFTPVKLPLWASIPVTERVTRRACCVRWSWNGWKVRRWGCSEARARFDRFLSGDSSAIHPNLRGVVYSLVIRNGGRAEFDQVLGLYQKFTVPDQKLSALGALGASRTLQSSVPPWSWASVTTLSVPRIACTFSALSVWMQLVVACAGNSSRKTGNSSTIVITVAAFPSSVVLSVSAPKNSPNLPMLTLLSVSLPTRTSLQSTVPSNKVWKDSFQFCLVSRQQGQCGPMACQLVNVLSFLSLPKIVVINCVAYYE